ncbi:U-box domain-containing protein 33 isoform X7 [Populus trichocarpa]|uniref:RING-type E3 ubiquitin transferase n=1 Tax=Populus trichocarpa TaxID=3694 RepID=A0A2K2BJK9_POPTR|nr:U-box domain-containing protein 33 isoform X7 [Populus trichocarpa]|eukprot:XP_024451885.1 U-box domain-containing protein 33 isoform X8 [Populus trichocarpa]
MATIDAEISEESMSLAIDDIVYVAVGKDVGESKSTLLWALQNFSIKKVCLVHVHQPAKMIPLIGGNFPASRLEQHELREFRELERKIMHKVLDDYLLLCHRAAVHAEKLYIEKDDIGKGIVELMYQHAIKKLVMGAAAERHYSEGMMDLQSRKAKYVQQCAPSSCQIWFICKGHLIHTGTSTDAFADLDPFTLNISGEITGLELELSEIPDMEEESDLHTPDALEQNSVEQLYKQLDRAMEEAEKFKREAFEESLIRGEAEKTSIKALRKVDVLSKLRHPHLVTLIGACSEACALIYEYLPNGNLEDRLNCEGNTPPLSWQVRIRIATELCSALIFLHSSTPTSIVHGDLKPGNVLLDANLSCKLSEFGICLADHNTRNITQYHKTDPEGTFLYLDPHFLTTGELSPKSDTYAFGIILLQLLTGRPEFGLVKEIRDVIDEENLTSLIDPLAGDWPFVQAMQLARLALKCCQMERSSRPDLASEVWSVLEPMRDSCGPLSRFQFGSLQCQTPPPYFICPILQEVMQDPHIAADGFTYEAEALRGWLESGHDTSPMTNLELERFELIPNHALRSVIQEWLQQH